MNTISRLLSSFRTFLGMFLPPGADSEQTRRASIAVGFSIIGIVFSAALGVLSGIRGVRSLMLADLAVAALLTANLVCYRVSRNGLVMSRIGVYTMGLTFAYCLLSGGDDNTGYLWCYCFPLVACFLLGSREGPAASVGLLVVAIAHFLFGDRVRGLADYPLALEIRFGASYSVVSLFAYLFEYFRESTQRELADQNRRMRVKMDELAAKEGELENANRGLSQEVEHSEVIQQALASARDEAEQANRAKSEFLANMSHELRTPLNHIIGFSELLYHGRLGELAEAQKEHLGDVISSGRHLLSLINDLLDLAKIEAGKVELTRSSVDIRALMQQGMSTVEEIARQKQIHASLECGALPERALLDEVKVKQVLFNLLSNAVKFTPPGGSVRVSCRTRRCGVRPGARVGDRPSLLIVRDLTGEELASGGAVQDCLECSVEDSGIGIRPEDLPRLFQRFSQLEPQLSRAHRGTGLGLALCRHLVGIQGGNLRAESAGSGKGSTFTFVVPMC